MKRYHIIFKGIVQGVGFRWTLVNLAKMYGLTGTCKNLDNGNVEVFVQGKSCDEFLKDVLKERRYIQIEDYIIKEIPTIDEREFSVIY